MASFEFNAAEVEPSQSSYDLLPKGKYLAMATSSERKKTNSGDGEYIAFTFEILDGPFKGRKIFEKLNLINPNPTTVNIARERLAELCRSTGVIAIERSEQLHDIPVMVDVVIKESKNPNYGPNNNIAKYSPASPNQDRGYAHEQPAANPVVAQAASAGSTPAWKRKAA